MIITIEIMDELIPMLEANAKAAGLTLAEYIGKSMQRAAFFAVMSMEDIDEVLSGKSPDKAKDIIQRAGEIAQRKWVSLQDRPPEDNTIPT
jgi:hypothetical protein